LRLPETYTAKTQSKGIYAFRYDATSGKLTAWALRQTPDILRGDSSQRQILYAVKRRRQVSLSRRLRSMRKRIC